MPTSPGRIPARRRRAFDVAAILALVVGAYVARRGSLPFDGLWFDDSWVAAGAIHGRPAALLTVGSGTPGFTAILMAAHRAGGSIHDLGIPSLVAGIACPGLLYLALRSVGYQRAVAALVSAALVVARIPILYSGRVKGYTFDTLWVLLLAIAVPRLAARTWRWPVGVMWAVCSIAIGTFSAYMMVAAAGAGLILLLHPSGDRTVRLGAVGIQGAVQLGYLVVSEKKADLNGIEKVLQDAYKAHIDFTWNPVHLADQSLTHLGRVAEVFPGGSGTWLTVFGVLAIAGLIAASFRGPRRAETVAGRYLLLLIVVAYVGSILHKFPFGPINTPAVSPGGRHSMWLVPAMAFGLAAVMARVRKLAVQSDAMRLAFDGIAVVAAVTLVVVSYQPAPPAPFPGSESGTRFVESSLGPNDVVIITATSTFSFADSATSPVHLVDTPSHQVGFAPVFTDHRIHVVGVWAVTPGTPAEIRSWVRNAHRVFVQGSAALATPGLQSVAKVLGPDGFTMQEHGFRWTFVQVWTR